MPAQRPIGLAHLSAMELEPHALIDLAHDVGCASVALRLHSAAPGTPVYEVEPDSPELTALMHHSALREVAISEVELVPITADLVVEGLRPLMAVARALAATGVIVTGDIADAETLREKFTEVCRLAGDHGLLVHLEFMRWRHIGTLSQAARLVQASGQDNARVLVDLLHLIRSGGTVADLLALPAGTVSLVQICDAQAELIGDIIDEARGGRLMPYTGALPIDAALAALGPDVDWALELPGLGDGDARKRALKQSVSAMQTAGVVA
ncbi:TIM barrel protein [Paracoccus sp. (in: a-proteobacteria)]|uniref:sugar phosphate isomerase/epimerase family protein n=1 Tax=Paracoccus sp. TaxID=267 RepID=UPI00321FD43A